MNRLLLLPLALLLAAPLAAQTGSGGNVSVNGEVDGRMVPRLDPGDARHAIVTRSGQVALLLTDGELLMQLTDHGREEMDREVEREIEREGVFAELIGEAVRGSLNIVFRRAMAFPLEEFRDVRYRDGRLEIVGREGKLLFDDMEINDERVMESFRERDARAFAEAFRRVRRQ